jgi:hypothetical protein
MNALRKELTRLCDGTLTYRELAEAVGRNGRYIEVLVREMNLPKPPRDLSNKRKRSPEALLLIENINRLCDGHTSSLEIAADLGCLQKYVQRIMKEFDLPRLPPFSPIGERNASYAGGRRIDQDGYVYVSAYGHPFAPVLKGKVVPRIYEHRLVVEKKLGRYLLPSEVVDHIDGITLHNHPDNLRVFASNADHLSATISEKVPNWSPSGLEKLDSVRRQRASGKSVDTRAYERKQGVVRLRKILLAWLSLDKDSPYLLGTHRWLARAGITDLSHSNLTRHYLDLNQRH